MFLLQASANILYVLNTWVEEKHGNAATNVENDLIIIKTKAVTIIITFNYFNNKHIITPNTTSLMQIKPGGVICLSSKNKWLKRVFAKKN